MSCFVATAFGDVSLSAIPDANFRSFLSQWDYGWEVYDSNGKSHWIGQNDGILSNGPELDGFPNTFATSTFGGVTTLKGIEFFPGLREIYCRNDGISEIDVTHNPALENLSCEGNKLTELNVRNNPVLMVLYCYENSIGELDVRNNTELIELMCDRNPIGQLDVSNCAKLVNLRCNSNDLKELNVRNNNALEVLYCYENNLTELDVSQNPKLLELQPHHNHIRKLDVSHNPELKYLFCGSNDLRELDVTSNLNLMALHCWGNHLTELDLSKNTALTDVVLGVQEADGLKVKVVPEGYEVCLNDYVSDVNNIELSSVGANDYSLNFIKYSNNDGKASVIFPEPPKTLHYRYNTHSPNNDQLYVVIKRSLNVDVIERGAGGVDNLIICGVADDHYIARGNVPITEKKIAKYSAKQYGKKGFVADGNSRLILRVQTTKPGTVSFSFNDDIGAKLESLSRKELSASDQLNTTEINSDTHQISAVLVAPERFPEDKSFPSDTFKVHVKFTDEDGEVTEDDLELKLEAAPVILIPGMFNPGGFTNVFAVASVLASAVNPGDSQHTFGLIQQELLSRGFKKEHIAFWNHSGSKGIKNLVGHDDNHLFTILANMFESYAQEGIVCTKADVIAHGMGGLIIREFLSETNKSDADDANNWSVRSYKQGMIHRVINIAVPHMGTPLANVLLGDFSVLGNVAIGNDALAQTCLWLLHNKYLKIYSEPFLKEIAIGSDFLNNLPLPANVPMHFVYGDVTGALKIVEHVKNLAFATYNIGKLAQSVKDISKISKLSEYEDFVKLSNAIKNSSPKNSLELLQTINKLDDRILARLVSQKDAIIKEFYKNYRSVIFSFTEMAEQSSLVTGLLQISEAVTTIALDGLSDMNPVALAFNLYFSMQRVIFSGQAHDMFVPVDSAVAMLREYSTGFPEPGTNSWMDWRFRYSTLCQQGDVAYAVATILRRNDMNDFAILKKSVQFTGASPQQLKANSTVYGELNLEGIDLDNLCATSFALTANQSTIMIPEMGTSVVKFTARTKNLVGNDVQLVIHKDGLDRTFPMYTDDGKSFEINIEFTSSDLGAMFAYCYTPNDKKLYVSNTLQLSCIRNLGNVDITEISFFGKDTLYTNVNSDIPAGLYAVDSDGRYYDVSSPLAGTQWTSAEIARVNENGCIYGLKEGRTTLTATFRGLTASINVEVSEALPEYLEPPVILTEAISSGIVGQSCSLQLEASGTAPMTWTISEGNLPDGLKLNASTGKITGTFTKAGTFKFTVKVTDNNNLTAVHAYTVKITKTTISGSIPTIGKVKVAYTGTLKASGGTSAYKWSISKDSLPDGLKINASTRKITGTPTKAGTFNFTVKVTDKNSVAATKAYTVKVTQTTIDGTIPTAGIVKASYTGTLKVSGGTSAYTWTISKGALPDGLKINASTGKITGKPTKAGTFSFTVKVTDKNGVAATKTFKVKITQTTLTATIPATIIRGKSYTWTPKATGGTETYKWTISEGKLPDGLKINASTGKITGTPTKAGTFNFTLKVMDKNSVAATKTFTVTINQTTLDGTIPTTGIVKASYTGVLKATGGTSAYTWSISKGALPDGLKINTSTGKITGKPTKSGTFSFTVKVTDKNGIATTKAFKVKVTQTTLTATIPATIVRGKSYTWTPKVTGGTSSYKWTISKGKLPTGLSINASTGKITGKPTKAGTFNFTVKVTDKNGVAATKAFTVKVTQTTIDGTIPTTGIVKASYTGTLKVTGGTSAYTWSISKGTLLNGLKIAPKTGKITGTPTKAGTFNFTVKVADKNGVAATKAFKVKITATTVSGTIPTAATLKTSYTWTLKAGGGTSPYTWTISKGSLPTGMKINASTGKITGKPTKAGSFTFTVKAKDKNGSIGTKAYTVEVTSQSASKTATQSITSDSETDTLNADSLKSSIPATAQTETLTALQGNGTITLAATLNVASDDVLETYEGKDSDLVKVKAGQPLTFIIGEWNADVSSINVYVDDKAVEGLTVEDSKFTLPAEMVHDDFKVSVKAQSEGVEHESEELYIISE